jgi:predicted RNA-binding protein
MSIRLGTQEVGVTRVEIDLNVRARGNWTFSGLEDADGPVEVGDIVEVYEAESGLVGPGRVECPGPALSPAVPVMLPPAGSQIGYQILLTCLP